MKHASEHVTGWLLNWDARDWSNIDSIL